MLWLVENLFWLIPTVTTIVLALINFFILRGQVTREKTQICILLMERRASVYYAFEEFFMNAPEKSKDQYSSYYIENFLSLTKESTFLFDDDIEQLKKEVIDLVKKLILTNKKIIHSQVSCDKTNYLRELDYLNDLISVHTQWVNDKRIYRTFSVYLNFKEFKLPHL